MATGNNSIYSNAFNFASFLSGGVDLRTGQYGINIDLADVKSHYLNGPTYKVNVGYSALNSGQNESGFGMGWSISGSIYDKRDGNNKKLTIASGETFLVDVESTTITFKDKKLNNFTITKTGDDYLVVYQDGKKEILSKFGATNAYVVSKLISKNGLEIAFDYQARPNNQLPRLTGIKEGSTSLVSLTYNEHVSVSIDKIGLDQTGKQTLINTTVKLINDRLHTISLPGNPTLCYTITYDSTLTGYIKQVDHPTGASEYIAYKSQGHHLPPGAPMTYLPYVISHRLVAGCNQPDVVKKYDYSPGSNFLGYGALTSWSSSGDNLYRVSNNYRYWGRETLDNRTTKETYDNFHLTLTKEIIVNNSTTTTLTMGYPIKDGQNFSAQPAQFQLATSQTVVFQKGTGKRQVTMKTMEYDEYGNLLSQTDASGLKTAYVYYSKDGESKDGSVLCPKDPDGFVRYVKSQTTTPNKAVASETQKTVTSTYQSIPSLNNHGSFIVPVSETSHTGLTRSFVYYQDASQAATYGKSTTVTETLNEKNTVRTYTYIYDADSITQTAQTKGYDQKAFSQATKLSRWSGNKLLVSDKDGIKNAVQYDALNRIVVATAAPNTSNAATKTFEYNMAAGNNYLTVTNVKGGKTRLLYDNAGRQIGEALWDATSQVFRTTKASTYNAKGQIVTETLTDWYNKKSSTLTKTYTYNDWEQRATTTYPDGHVELSEIDPIASTKRTGIQGLCILETKYNDVQQEIEYRKILPNAAAGSYYAVATKTYDGYNRLASQTDFKKNTTTVYADSFDRYYRIDAPEGLTTVQSFIDFRPENLVAQIKAGKAGEEIELGARGYDGVGRVISETKNKLTTTYKYTTSQLQYDSLVTPKGDTVSVSYNKALRAIESKTIGSIKSTYSYDSQSGLTLNNTNAAGQNDFTYDSNGAVLTQKTGNKTFTAEYSLLGNVHAQTDYFGTQSTITYDAYGRLQEISSNQSSVKFSVYDAYGRVTGYKYSAGAVTLQASLTLDHSNRETQRVVTLSTGEVVTVDQAFDENDRLTARTRSLGSVKVLQENFTYDGLGRLTSYLCSGSAAPKDEYGLTLKSESYTFNETMSLKTVEREFTDGRKNTSTYAYASDNPIRATKVTNTLTAVYPSSIDLSHAYDANGNLTKNTQWRTMTYDGLNQLTSVTNNGAQVSYERDAAGKLCSIKANGQTTQLWYHADQLIAESTGGQSTVYNHGLNNQVVGGITTANGTTKPWTVATDAKGSTVLYADSSTTKGKQYTYTPYGQRSEVTSQSGNGIAVSFNGERLDEQAGLYHLGNGYRTYDPVMMRFYSPDSLSPFDKAGINVFGYCNGDPINLTDPSGHMPKWLNEVLNVTGLVLGIAALGLAIVGLTVATGGVGLAFAIAGVAGATMGVVSGALGVTSASLDLYDENHGTDHSSLSKKLGIASLAFGIGSLVTGGVGAVGSVARGIGAAATVAEDAIEMGEIGTNGYQRLIDSASMASRSSLFSRVGLDFVGGFVGISWSTQAIKWIPNLVNIANFGVGGYLVWDGARGLSGSSSSNEQGAIQSHTSGAKANGFSNPTVKVGSKDSSSKVIQLPTPGNDDKEDLAPKNIRSLS
eukprot:gene121-166_t